MAYRYDEDLEFLRDVKSSDLNDLVDVLTKDKDGEKRITEYLTTNDLYKQYYPDHKKYIHIILNEIQTFGGNSFANAFRGGGVMYREILCDVCNKLKVNYNKKSSTETIETNLFMKILEDAWKEMSDEDKKALMAELKIPTMDLTKQGGILAFRQILRMGGFKTYQLAQIIVQAVWKFLFGHGLRGPVVAGWLKFLMGPVGFVVAGIWTTIDLAGPAYRVTVPVVLQVALLRQRSKLSEEEKKKFEE